jgi:hypothetical protein
VHIARIGPDGIGEEFDGPVDRDDLIGRRPPARALPFGPEPQPRAVDLLDAVGLDRLGIDDLVLDPEPETGYRPDCCKNML